MTPQDVTKTIEIISKPYGFLRKGNAFFRIQGDGVLQTIKWEYEPHAGSHVLYFGLLSMYGKIMPQWLTSRGCIPIYEAMRLADKDYFRIKLDYGDWIVAPMHGQAAGTGMIDPKLMKSTKFQEALRKARRELDERIKPEVQLETFEEIVLPKLDQIDTQAEMYNTICFYSKVLNNSYKIAPLLACSRYEEALKVVRAILQQNRNAFIAKGIPEAEWMQELYYPEAVTLESLILQGSEAVQNFLKSNFITNYDMFSDAFYSKQHTVKNYDIAKCKGNISLSEQVDNLK